VAWCAATHKSCIVASNVNEIQQEHLSHPVIPLEFWGLGKRNSWGYSYMYSK
jgi:hypothetical protein